MPGIPIRSTGAAELPFHATETQLPPPRDRKRYPTVSNGNFRLPAMRFDDLYDSLIHARERGVRYIVTFCDGDSYWLSDIDLCFSVGRDGQREYEPLRVDFSDCIGDSMQQRKVQRDDAHLPNIWITSDGNHDPIGCDYSVADVSAVFDDDRQFAIYSRSMCD